MRCPPLFTSPASWLVKWPPGDQAENNTTHLGQRWRLGSAWRRWLVEGWPHTHTDTPPSWWHSTSTSTQAQEHRRVVTSPHYSSVTTPSRPRIQYSLSGERCCHVMQVGQHSLSQRLRFPREGRFPYSSSRNVQLCPSLLLFFQRVRNILAIAKMQIIV